MLGYSAIVQFQNLDDTTPFGYPVFTLFSTQLPAAACAPPSPLSQLPFVSINGPVCDMTITSEPACADPSNPLPVCGTILDCNAFVYDKPFLSVQLLMVAIAILSSVYAYWNTAFGAYW
eukprot:scaffold2224_cov261-Pinguiococcus_pyrenoidosus.AAC.46